MSANKCVLCAETMKNEDLLCLDCVLACDNHPKDTAYFAYIIGRAPPPQEPMIPSADQLRQSLKTLEKNQRAAGIAEFLRLFADMINNHPQSDSWTVDARVAKVDNLHISKLIVTEVVSRLTSLGYRVSVDNYNASITARLPDEAAR